MHCKCGTKITYAHANGTLEADGSQHTPERCLTVQLATVTRERDEWNGTARRDVARLKLGIQRALESVEEDEVPTAVACLHEALGAVAAEAHLWGIFDVIQKRWWPCRFATRHEAQHHLDTQTSPALTKYPMKLTTEVRECGVPPECEWPPVNGAHHNP
jgi:hypothetical protein